MHFRVMTEFDDKDRYEEILEANTQSELYQYLDLTMSTLLIAHYTHLTVLDRKIEAHEQ